jgi:hypothetical protein
MKILIGELPYQDWKDEFNNNSIFYKEKFNKFEFTSENIDIYDVILPITYRDMKIISGLTLSNSICPIYSSIELLVYIYVSIYLYFYQSNYLSFYFL